MLRAAAKTVVGYADMVHELEEWASLGVPVAARLRGSLTPPGWDCPSFATHLHRASQGLGLGLDQHAVQIKALFDSLVADRSGGRKNIQAAFYKLLCTFYPSNWAGTLERKVAAFSCVEVPPRFFRSSEFDSVIPIVKSIGVRGATSIVKTWANAWTTSSRMHEAAVLPCIFGCGAVDSLDHYLCCDPLWTVVISCTHGHSELLQASPLTKLGFGQSPLAWLQRLCVAFRCYHAIKLGHRSEIQCMVESGNPCQVLLRLFNYAGVFSRDFKWTHC